MIHKRYELTCSFDGCKRSTPSCSTIYTVVVWMLANHWETAWHYEYQDACPSFRIRCPLHPLSAE